MHRYSVSVKSKKAIGSFARNRGEKNLPLLFRNAKKINKFCGCLLQRNTEKSVG